MKDKIRSILGFNVCLFACLVIACIIWNDVMWLRYVTMISGIIIFFGLIWDDKEEYKNRFR